MSLGEQWEKLSFSFSPSPTGTGVNLSPHISYYTQALDHEVSRLGY